LEVAAGRTASCLAPTRTFSSDSFVDKKAMVTTLL